MEPLPQVKNKLYSFPILNLKYGKVYEKKFDILWTVHRDIFV